jgi:hypothetical protein
VDSVLTDVENIISQSYLLIPLFIMLLLPGRLVLDILPDRHKFDWGEKVAISLGISIALIPVILLWTTLINFSWRREFVIALYIFLTLFYTWNRRHAIRGFVASPKIRVEKNMIVSLSLLAIFILTLFTRFAMVRDMAAPAWVDSVHHAMITNIIISDIGKFPQSYLPFIEIESATYHPGFHSMAAVVHWLTNLEIQDSLLIFGQVLNAFSIFAVYLLSKALTKSQFAALIAAIVTGLITPMPAYYTSWGRYTQLAGLLILPVAFTLVIYSINKFFKISNLPHKPDSTRQMAWLLTVTAILVSGLFLTHYRVTAYLVILVLAFLLIKVGRDIIRRDRNQPYKLWIGFLLLLSALIILLTLPWWPEALSNLIIPRITQGTNITVPFDDFSWFYLTTALGTWAIITAGLGFVLGIIQKKGFVIVLLLWITFLFLLANLGALSIPGGELINNTSVTIMLFIPISILTGYLIAWVIKTINSWLQKPWKYIFQVSAAISGILIMLLGVQSILPILNPITMQFREADLPAIHWIEKNIPENEIILINPFNWGYGMYAGNDGGYWISPLADHITMPPPVLYGLNPEIGAQIVEASKQVIAKSDDIDALHTYLLEQGIRYVYVGARGGALSPRDMNNSPLFSTLYNNEGTWVFEVLSPSYQ